MDLALDVWDWEQDYEMNDEELKEYHRQKSREWNAAHPERVKETNRKAVRKYYAKKKNDPEYMQKKREGSAKYMRDTYKKKRSEMTEEELEEYRRVTRERVRAIRAKKKAEKLALEQASKEKGQE